MLFQNACKRDSLIYTSVLYFSCFYCRVRGSFVEVNIYYESLSHTFSSEIPQMDLVSMLAFIGGNLGLFMGMRVLSLFEMIEGVIELFYMTKK